MGWCTTADVATYTGVTATDPQVAMAQAQIDVFCGITSDAAAALATDARSLHWLKLATAYQTAWMLSQPDLFTRSSVASMSQDGMTINFEMRGGETSDSLQIMSPLARRALRRLRWMGSRSMRIRKDRSDWWPNTAVFGVDPLRDTNDDDYMPWSQMAGGR